MTLTENAVDGPCCVRRWMIVVCTLLIALIIGFVLYAFKKEKDPREMEHNMEDLIVYPLFRTPAEQEEFETKYFAEMAAREVETYTGYDSMNCNLTCSAISPLSTVKDEKNTETTTLSTPTATKSTQKPFQRRRRRASDLYPVEVSTELKDSASTHSQPSRKKRTVTHHGCCITEVTFIDPPEAINSAGEEVQVVQFEGLNQYFASDSCRHDEGCEGCTCSQEDTYAVALCQRLSSDRRYTIYYFDLIVLPGCCKCLNAV